MRFLFSAPFCLVSVIVCFFLCENGDIIAASVPPPPSGKFYQGFYYSGSSDNENGVTPADVSLYEQTVGARATWVFFSDNWYESRKFPSKLCGWIHGLGKVPYIRLMLRSVPDQDRAEKVFTLDAISAGKFDGDLKRWAAGAKEFGAPLLVEWGTECNGEWFAWNGKWNGKAAGPAKFISAWRHIVKLMRGAGCSNITWVWHVDSSDVPDVAWNHFENYYPGDDYVDWLAVSAYGPLTPGDKDQPLRIRDLLDDAYPRLAAVSPTKPIILAEFGCAQHHPAITAAAWAQDALTDLFSGRWPRICGFCWWNEHWQNDDVKAHDTDMIIMDDPAVAKVFRTQFSAAKEKIQEKAISNQEQ
jgi:hypothetical protein